MGFSDDVQAFKDEIVKPKISDKTEPDTLSPDDEAFCFDALADLVQEAYDLNGQRVSSSALVVPVISSTWTLFKNDGVTPYVFDTDNVTTNKNIVVDKGVKASLVSYYIYPDISAGYSLPTSVSGDYGTGLPGPNVQSQDVSLSNIAVNTSVAVQLSKPKTGLMANLVTGQVTDASGNDITGDSSSIVYNARSYVGYSVSALLSDVQIAALPNKTFSTSRARTIAGITAPSGYYTYYVYDASFGDLTNVIMNGAEPILGAFRKLADVAVVNDAGLSVTMRVYRSNAVQAFTNNTLSFS